MNTSGDRTFNLCGYQSKPFTPLARLSREFSYFWPTMMNKFLCFFAVILIVTINCTAFGQSARADNSRDAIDIFLRHSHKALNSNLDSALFYSRLALLQSNQLGDQELIAKSFKSKGEVFFRKSGYDSALYCFDKALLYYRELEDEIASARIHMSKGNVFYRRTDHNKAMEEYMTAYEKFASMREELNAAHVLNNLGNLYLDQGDYQKARKSFEEALEIRKEQGSSDDVAASLNNLGNLNLKQKNWEIAKNYFVKTLRIDLENDNKTGQSGSYNNLGIVYKYLGDLDSSLIFHQRSYAIDKELGNVRGIAGSLNNISTIYENRQECEKALTVLKECLAICKEYGEVDVEMDALRNLTDLHRECGNFKLALEALQAFNKLEDSVFSQKNKEQIEEMKARFDFQKQELKIKNAENEVRYQKQLRYLTGAAAVLILLIILLLLNRRYFKQKLQMEKQRVILENKALYLQMNPHFIFNSLGAISSFISGNDPKSSVQYLSKFARLMRNMLENSREASITIDKELEGLRQYLELEKLRFDDKFEFEITTEKVKVNWLIPSMMIQPYVENAIIHGVVPGDRKGKISVRFYTAKNELICSIKDNGIGRKKSGRLGVKDTSEHLSSAMKINEKRLEVLNFRRKSKMSIEVADIPCEGDITEVCGTEVRINFGNPSTN